MAKHKERPEQTEDVSVFPEGHVMNEWSHDPYSTQKELLADRSREDQFLNTENESAFHIPEDWCDPEYQYAWIVEYVLGEPQKENLRRRRRQGWEFVNEDEIPQMKFDLMDHEFDRGRNDPWIHCGGQVLMKKNKVAYLRDQESKRARGEEIQKESMALTNYMGGAGRDPRFIAENTGKYQPSHTMKRG